MAEFPALPLWTDAYLADTGHLTTLEHGAYLLLLMTMWRNGGSLPNDDKRLARFARLTAGQWKRIKPTIMEFFTVEGDEIMQTRLTAEMGFVRQHSKKQSDRSKARWLKTKKPDDPAGVPERCRSDAPTPTPKEEVVVSEERARENAARDMSFLDAAIAALGPAASPISTGFTMVQLNQWKEQGCSEQHILEWLRARAPRLRPNSIGSFAYFRSGPVDALSDPPRQPRREKTAGEKLEALRRKEAMKRAATGTGG